jgi:hypothetical protein
LDGARVEEGLQKAELGQGRWEGLQFPLIQTSTIFLFINVIISVASYGEENLKGERLETTREEFECIGFAT